jgi:VIT1/CCC1 family predicted Fe2+/Mn2+ transporter
MKSHNQDIIGGIVALVVFFILSAIGQGEIASFALIATIVCFVSWQYSTSVKTAKRKRMELATLKDNRLKEGGNS